MRATSKMTNHNNLLYISRNFTNLNKTSGQLANQRQVQDLKDDPMSANIGIQMSTLVARSEQYNRNLKSGVSQLSLSDSRLQTAKKQMDEIKKIITGAANEPSTSAETRSANATQLNEIFKTLVGIGNASDGTRYIFGGSKTAESPFEIVNGRYVSFTGNQDKINIVVDANTTMPINVTGSDIYGNMTTTIPSKDMNPSVNMSTDNSTRLSDLNGGAGVPKGKILVKYGAYPDGIEVDLSNCDTLEDVKDAIEYQTLEASKLKDRTEYVKVTANPEKNGISLQEYNSETKVATNGNIAVEDYASNKVAEGLGIRGTSGRRNADGTIDPVKTGVIIGRDLNPVLSERTLLADLDGYNDSSYTFTNGPKTGTIQISEVSQDSSNIFNSWNLDGLSIGKNTGEKGELYAKAVLLDGETTLSSDLHFSSPFELKGPASLMAGQVFNPPVVSNKGNTYSTIGAGGIQLADDESISFTTTDFPDGVTLNKGTVLSENPNPTIVVQLYTKPVDKATAADLVATGTYSNSGRGGTVNLEEVNSSGISGTVGIVMPSSAKEATVNLNASFPDSLQGTVHVPAFVEEKNPDGTDRDVLNIASGWNIKGLDKPPAESYNQNHPASTDLDGNVSVNYRYDGKGYLNVELSRPAYGDQPAKLLATGKIFVGENLNDPSTPLKEAVSGRVEFVGAEGFEGVSGSVFIELPKGTYFTSADQKIGQPTVDGNGAVTSVNPTTSTVILGANSDAGTIVTGGAMELEGNMNLTNPSFVTHGPTTFKKDQVFDNAVRLPNGGVLPAGQPLTADMTLPKGTRIEASTLLKGTVIAEGQRLEVAGVPADTVVPRGSYYETAGDGFPAGGMGVSIKGDGNGSDRTTGTMAGYNVQATFATIEDLNRAVEELGIHVSAKVSSDGKGIEFTSRLAGAWLTVSEDTDCYEQMGDKYNQLTGLDLNGLVKGENTDSRGNVYTEVIFYPPSNPEKDANGNIIPVRLVADDGTVSEIEPGYYIRVYSDKSALDKTYENRDGDSLVAEGFVPAGKWKDPADAANPFEKDPLRDDNPPIVGFLNGVVLEERNNSGVNGQVNLDYYGGRSQAEAILDANGDPTGDYKPISDYKSSPYWNDNITVFPGGMRPAGSDYVTIQEVDVFDVTPGVHADYTGTIHATATKKSTNEDGTKTAFGVDIAFYRDSSHTHITGKSDPKQPFDPNNPNTVYIYSVDKDGNYLDKDGKTIKDPSVNGGVIIGTININPDNNKMADPLGNVAEGTMDSFTINTGANRNYGQEREENVFSTINDAIDALNRNDTEALHNLLEDAQRDIDRILASLADVGARQDRMELLQERHTDDVVKFSDMFTKRVGMDDTALAKAVLGYQAATNSYQAAMQVSASIMQMSLLQYI